MTSHPTCVYDLFAQWKSRSDLLPRVFEVVKYNIETYVRTQFYDMFQRNALKLKLKNQELNKIYLTFQEILSTHSSLYLLGFVYFDILLFLSIDQIDL
jgi:hypothetical protein